MSDVTVKAPQSGRIEGFAEMTPGQRIMALAGRTQAVTDAEGRTIRFRVLKPLDRMRLKRMAGQDSSNAAFMEDVLTAASVTAIGDDTIPFPMNIRECEAIMSRLGDHGLAAMADGVTDMFGGAEQADAIAAQVVADAKN